MSGISFKKPTEDAAGEPPLPIKSLASMAAELADPVMDSPVAPAPVSVPATAAVDDGMPVKRRFMVSLEHNPKPEVVEVVAPANSDWVELATQAFYKKKGIYTSVAKPKVQDHHHGEPAPIPAS